MTNHTDALKRIIALSDLAHEQSLLVREPSLVSTIHALTLDMVTSVAAEALSSGSKEEASEPTAEAPKSDADEKSDDLIEGLIADLLGGNLSSIKNINLNLPGGGGFIGGILPDDTPIADLLSKGYDFLNKRNPKA